MPADVASTRQLSTPSVLVMAIGEAHQLLHVLGAARALQCLGVPTHILVSTHWHEDLIAAHTPELSAAMIRTPIFYRRRSLNQSPPRAPNLFLSLSKTAKYSAVLTPERTSTLLKKWLGDRCPKLLHIPHGAGDRAKGYEERIKLFDQIYVAGQKDHDAFIAYGVARPDNCHVVGYCKFDVLKGDAPRFFENDKPVVLYNPHFDEKLGSWLPLGRQLIDAFAQAEDLNFIIAPHVRLRGKGRALFRELAHSVRKPNLRFDGGSIHSINMDYTRAAGIYLGDVSSQVYEFLRTPKPCVYVNAWTIDWSGNPFYRHWTYGDVGRSADEAMSLIRSAVSRHAQYKDLQMRGFEAATAPGTSEPSRLVAESILAFLYGAAVAQQR